jgi:hypothetical protein
MYSIVIGFLGISYDTYYTIKYGGIDMRNRVVGVRNLLIGNDPYFTKWTQETPDYYVDGRDYFFGLPVSRCTVTPSFLVLHAPFASIFYKIQQYIWMALQELMLFFCIYWFAKSAKERWKIVLIIGLMFFIGSYFWRFHVANGQIYILFTFMITLAYIAATSKLKYSDFWAGFILGITTTWRPPMLLMGMPLLLFRKWKMILGGLTGILAGFLSSFFIAGISTWKNYFDAMKIYGDFHIGLIGFELGVHNHFNNTEGMRNTFFSADVPGSDSSIQGILYKHFEYGLKPSILWLALFIVIVMLAISLWKKRNHRISNEAIFYFGAFLVLLSEFFMPAPRLSYNNVLWLFMFGMLLVGIQDWKKLVNSSLIFLLIGLAANYLYNIHPKSIMLADYSMVIYFIWMWFGLLKIQKTYRQH